MIEKTKSPLWIELTPFGREDFDQLISWLPTEGDLVEWCAAFFNYPLTHSQLERYLESSKTTNARLIFTARTLEDGPVGHVEISQIWPHLSSRLSRVLIAPDKRRRGLGCGMINKALSLSFGQHSVDRVDLGVSATNLMAIGCYAKLGFAQVGLWSKAIVAGSRALDVVWMTLTRDRWAQSCAEP